MKGDAYTPFFVQGTVVLLTVFIGLAVYKWNDIESFQSKVPLALSELTDIPFHIDRKTRNMTVQVSGVPLTIYQSWHSNMVPPKMADTIYKLLEMNPEFDYYLYSDANSLKFIMANFGQEVATAFKSLKPGAYKSDLWRYCVLYVNGGMYLDIKYYSTMPIIDIIRENPVIYVKDLPGSCGNDIGLYNAFMVSPPKNEIFKYCIDDIVNSCRFKLYKKSGLDITGPCLLADILRKYEGQKYIDSLKFQFGYVHYLGIVSDRTVIRYDNSAIFKIYDEYRDEQSKFQKSEHYGVAWDRRNVYN